MITLEGVQRSRDFHGLQLYGLVSKPAHQPQNEANTRAFHRNGRGLESRYG